MRVDTQGAIELVRFAARHNWEWTEGGITALCDATGWSAEDEEVQSDQRGTSWLATNLQVDRPSAQVSRGRISPLLAGQTIESVRVPVSDQVRTDNARTESEVLDEGRMMLDAFTDLGNALVTAVSPPSQSKPGLTPSIRWEHPTVVISLQGTPSGLVVTFDNPVYIGWIDQLDQFHVTDADLDLDDEFDDEDSDEYEEPSPYSSIEALNLNSADANYAVARVVLDLRRTGVVDLTYNDQRVLQISYRSRDDSDQFDTISLTCNLIVDPFGDSRCLNESSVESVLTGAGWVRIENGPGNFWRMVVDWPAHYETIFAFADKVVSALRQYFSFEDPSLLELKTY
ncbi:DUF6301 family protein [Nocardia sp. CDC153]|uniref:DUF6301 family protein n=1 Tax=Nocardia sp. CDC153 TaxID=3112167 RepID=UPI002DBC30FF|nr:DUF6301 family protein [Nocardia sp. CDC153]MEC3955815.1 DUF6301 family protein [Nocardia sp. CDC153]